MPNKVISSTIIKTISVHGKALIVKYATRTETWYRPYLSTTVQSDFASAVEKADIPAGATVAIMTESEHPSQSDSADHFTTVYDDSKGNHIKTKHVYR
ncbi:hypothetical protein F503_08349 [Ophiostoma piceae UAMH 11346]|uniref:Uncharacterized protein n=1 Tax=Ophiostoma piceae (strain UAMH 11346) TaxID=1262450 RepID=S3CHK5_OPHP1|nr:hypothetical protein F503_08349 [Ophiostoma piceae UAMH 11346]